jgi:hypothetical protein
MSRQGAHATEELSVALNGQLALESGQDLGRKKQRPLSEIPPGLKRIVQKGTE